MTQYCCENSRRLTGANLFSDRAGAVLDVVVRDNSEKSPRKDQISIGLEEISRIWTRHARSLLNALGWESEITFMRQYDEGVSLGITAPIDCLYSAADLAESALLLSARELHFESIEGIEVEVEADFDAVVAHLQTLIAEEQNPALLALGTAAGLNDALFLFDDDTVSVGSGAGCQQWPVDQIPAPGDINWSRVSRVPLALITGTNGKSTSVRLAAAIGRAASLKVGSTSTDYIKVGDTVIDKGDYSGPGGARTLLRDERVEIAFLELARGGLLRRGLGVPEADAALITNVAADHLGDYGINTVAELIEAKFIVRRALTGSKPLVLNADDTGVVSYAKSLDQTIVWFSEDMANSVIVEHLHNAGEAVTIAQEQVVHIVNDQSRAIVDIREIPITLNGRARHNVQNVLGVVALSCVLGIDCCHIKTGLLDFTGNVEDNPGRGNLFEVNDVKILIDFAHNEHGMLALASTVAGIESERRLILMGQAGDRSDDAIVDLVNAAMTAQPEQVVVSNTPGYERGRKIDETSEVIIRALTSGGFKDENIMRAADPVEGVRMALEWSRPGDLLLLIILTNRDEVINLLKETIAS